MSYLNKIRRPEVVEKSFSPIPVSTPFGLIDWHIGFGNERCISLPDRFRRLVAFLQELKFIQGPKSVSAYLLTTEWESLLGKRVRLVIM